MARQVYHQQLAKTPAHVNNIYQYFAHIDFGDDYHGCMMVNTLNNRHAVPEKAFQMVNDFIKWVRSLYLENLQAEVTQGRILLSSPIESWCDLLLSFDVGLSVSGAAFNKMDSGVMAKQALDALLSTHRVVK